MRLCLFPFHRGRCSTVFSPDGGNRYPKIVCPRISCLRFALMSDKRQSRYLYRTCSCISLPGTIRTGDILQTIRICSKADTIRCLEKTSAVFTRMPWLRNKPREHMIGRATKWSGIRVLEMHSQKPPVKSSQPRARMHPGKGFCGWDGNFRARRVFRAIRVPVYGRQPYERAGDSGSALHLPVSLSWANGHPGLNFDYRACPSSSSLLPTIPCSNSSSQPGTYVLHFPLIQPCPKL